MNSDLNSTPQDNSADRLLRLRQVLQIIPLSKSAWYQGVAEGRFPRPVKLTARAVAWRKSDVDALLRGQLEIEHANSGESK
jgi:prophage regulatory protein